MQLLRNILVIISNLLVVFRPKHILATKWPPRTPFGPIICILCIVFREESDFGTPGAWFRTFGTRKFFPSKLD